MTTPPIEVRLVRTFAADPSRVYRAWLDPDLVRQWFAPSDWTVGDVAVEARVGGRHSVHHLRDGRDEGGFESRIVDLVPDRRIVFAWGFVGPDHVADPAHESLLTIDLEPTASGGTVLTLVHTRLEKLGTDLPEIAGGVRAGWTQALDKLEGSLT